MADNDELVSQFLAFTGSADPERAASYLEMSNGNLETAVGLYMEHQGGGGGPLGVPQAAASSVETGPVGGFDDVRAPDATRTMRLMDEVGGSRMGGGMSGLFGNPYMALDPILHHQLASSAFARDAVNNAVDAAMDLTGDDDNDENKSDDGEEGNEERKSNTPGVAGLADMFAAPQHLMYTEGGFEGARTMAKDTKRWLLVNLQRDSEFSCHALNRDVWRDELVENLIREGFVFWQAMDIAPEGSVYAQRYKVYDYPHIGIIDPRTGRLMWKKEGWTQQHPLTSEQFAEIAMDFCSRNSFDKPPQAPRPKSTRTVEVAQPTKRPMHEMTEEEQLQAAMRASLQESGEMIVDEVDDDDYLIEDDDDDEVQIVDVKGTDGGLKPAAQIDNKPAEVAKPAAATSILQQLLDFDLGEEPEKGARIQFRLPDGKRKVRKFDPSQNVRLVYAFVAQSLTEVKEEEKEFSLMAGFPPKDLISNVDNTIASCSLSGEAITVRWK